VRAGGRAVVGLSGVVSLAADVMSPGGGWQGRVAARVRATVGGETRRAAAKIIFMCLSARRCCMGGHVEIGFCATSVGVWSSARKLTNFRRLILLRMEIK
jgi:hypothetical protein